MFRRLLLPIDMANRHEAALAIAAEMANQSRGEVTLLHVIQMVPGVDPAEDESFYRRLEQMADKHLRQMCEWLDERAVRAQSETVVGDCVEEILRYAAATEADLLLVTARPFDADKPTASWGSISWKLVVMAPCPVLLVK